MDNLHPCQKCLLENYASESDFENEPDAWRRYHCKVKSESKLIRNDRDLKVEVLWKFCHACKLII